MPPGRPTTRQRLVSNENDENISTTRLTRAKAAALNVDELSLPSKAALQTKKSAVNVNTQAGQRKRSALGDVSNVTKVEADGKKAAVGKSGLVSKAAQPSGIQKKTSTAGASRTALAAKETSKKAETKRSGSGSGAIGAVQKRKVPSSTSNPKEEAVPDESGPVRKKVHTVESDKRTKTDEQPAAAISAPELSHGPQLPPGVKNYDAEDLDDPLMVAEYAQEIFDYLRDLEYNSLANPEYMMHQDDLDWKSRGILVDWLVEVHTRFHLLPETLYLAVNIIDRFLSEKVVQLERLQLVGVTAMFIASKYEEVLSPHVSNFRHVADNGFREAEILSAERFILSTLDYDLSYPNPMNFLRRISKADNYDINTRTIGKFLLELSLLDHRFLAYRPSHIAAAAMYLARLILDRGEWDQNIAHHAGYTEEEIAPVYALMVDYLIRARPLEHDAFIRKYAHKKFLKASILTRKWAQRHAAHFDIVDPQLTIYELEEEV